MNLVLTPPEKGGWCGFQAALTDTEAMYKILYMTQPTEKTIVWLGDSLDALKAMPIDAKRELGFDLSLIQAGGRGARL